MIENKRPEIWDLNASDKTWLLNQKEEHMLKGHFVDGIKTQKQHPLKRSLSFHRSRKGRINDALMWNILRLDFINIQYTRWKIIMHSGFILD